MPCIAPPPPQIEATIEVGAAPDYVLVFTPSDQASANYIDSHGNLDFNCFQGPIKVQFTITTPGVGFYKGDGRDSISFADDATQGPGAKQPVTAGHHQFRHGFGHQGAQTITFEYHNDWDCGAGDNVKKCPQGRYGLYLGGPSGFLHHADPIISNGGSPP